MRRCVSRVNRDNASIRTRKQKRSHKLSAEVCSVFKIAACTSELQERLAEAVRSLLTSPALILKTKIKKNRLAWKDLAATIWRSSEWHKMFVGCLRLPCSFRQREISVTQLNPFLASPLFLLPFVFSFFSREKQATTSPRRWTPPRRPPSWI